MKYIIYSVMIVLMLSCESKTKMDKPENLLTKKQMIELLTDMHLANSTSGVNNIHEEKNKNYMSLVYEKYKVDSVQFAESNMYYAANVEEYEDIFLKVEKRIKVIQKKYQTELDSILENAEELREGATPKENIRKLDDNY